MLEAWKLHKQYDAASHAVNEVSLKLHAHETLGLVGESGSGKSTLARLLIGLERADSGTVSYRGEDYSVWNLRQLRAIRRKVQMVFQNSLSAFNPMFTIEQIIDEPLRNYRMGDRPTRRQRVLEVLEQVELGQAFLRRYPHELSGGQQQRVGIARAIVMHPEIIICDEPFSNLDVTLRKKMMRLLEKLKHDLRLSYVFITHDLSLIADFCDRVAVMYQGQIIEEQNGHTLLTHARHPYTRKLVASLPIQHPGERPSMK